MLHETIRNDDFSRNTAFDHCYDIVSNGYNMQRCVASHQQQPRRLRKRHLKSEFVLLQTLLRLLHLVQFVNCWHFFSGVELKKTCIEVQE